MKSYFAKWLPVEGEIKDGDEYLTHTGERKIASIPKEYNNPHVPYYDGYKKVQLFLCFKDIKIGDTVWDILNKKFVDVDTSFIANETSSGKNVPCWYLKTEPKTFHETEFLIKVIGPISIEAKWVKESDEFDENEACEKQELDVSDETHGTGIYEIKCPCCGEFK